MESNWSQADPPSHPSGTQETKSHRQTAFANHSPDPAQLLARDLHRLRSWPMPAAYFLISFIVAIGPLQAIVIILIPASLVLVQLFGTGSRLISHIGPNLFHVTDLLSQGFAFIVLVRFDKKGMTAFRTIKLAVLYSTLHQNYPQRNTEL